VKYLATTLCTVAAFAVVSSTSLALAADPPRVVQSIVIDGNTDSILADAQKTRAIFKRLGIDATRRFYRATLAGESTGTLALAIEYPNLAALAAAQAKLADDKEWQAYLDKITGQDVNVVSNSVYVEVAPAP
jgi:hypothetical protein